MKKERIKCPCGCESELMIGIAEEGDFFKDTGKILISVGKQNQRFHKFAVVINKKILDRLNSFYD